MTVSRGKRQGAGDEARARRRFRVLPRKRAGRIAVYLFLAIGYIALMWFLVFPWVDRTFVNRPAI